MKRKLKREFGFTLIELLIVVAIIAILAAIAIPNFLAAQVRSKVARTLGEFRSMSTAIESFYIDNNEYPPTRTQSKLTTPIAYMSSIPKSPWHEVYVWNDPPTEFTTINQTYLYVSSATTGSYGNNPSDIKNDYFYYIGMQQILDPNMVDIEKVRWELKSVGPDGKDDVYEKNQNRITLPYMYDPSNGTVSPGDIVWFNDGTGTGKGR